MRTFSIVLILLVSSPAFCQDKAVAQQQIFLAANAINAAHDGEKLNTARYAAAKVAAGTTSFDVAQAKAAGKLTPARAAELASEVDGIYYNVRLAHDRGFDAFADLLEASTALKNAVDAFQGGNFAEALKQSSLSRRRADSAMTDQALSGACLWVAEYLIADVTAKLR